jgi:hypothetical protein
MPRHARPADHAAGAALALVASRYVIGPVCRRKKTLAIAGTALALASAGSATAATNPSGQAASARRVPAAHLTADVRPAKAPRRRIGGRPTAPAARPHAVPLTWAQVQDALNWQTNPAAAAQGKLPFADQLMPVGASGPQNWMPISGAQLANATTIVQQALAMRMGVRSAVIAVATAMQESELQNIGYGTGDSVGLFQQQPDCGWGTAQQIMNPAFAADAFLAALQQYQASNPGWAAQPLWVSAQSVQKSGAPFAYAQWESQAASLVKQTAMSLQQ